MKMNTKQKIGKTLRNRSDLTTNHEGGLAFSMSPKLELYQRVATWLVNEPKFYGDNASENVEIISLIQHVAKKDPEFILQLATYCRQELYLRSAPIVLLVEASLIDTCKPFVRKYTPRIVTRADQITEALAYLKSRIGDIGDGKKKGSIPAGLKKGLADSANHFDEYQFGKYNRDAEFKMKDALRLVHPIPQNKKQSKIYKQIIEGTLKAPETWEVVVSTKGSSKETWESIIPNMGYMGTLRNARNFLDKGVDLEPVIERLVDENQVRKSKQFVTRFLSAYKAVQDNISPYTVKMLDAITEAMEKSMENISPISGVTSLWADHSGSMGGTLSGNSEMTHRETADCMLGIAHRLSKNPITGAFGENLKVINITKRNSLISVIKELGNVDVGHITNTFLIMEYLIKNKIKVDRIMVFTDEQGYGGWFVENLQKYRASINPNVYVYMVNLSGYGTSEVPENDPRSIMLGGFSDKIFKFVEIFESDKTKVLAEIESITPDGED